jgi:hypothetical protein
MTPAVIAPAAQSLRRPSVSFNTFAPMQAGDASPEFFGGES